MISLQEAERNVMRTKNERKRLNNTLRHLGHPVNVNTEPYNKRKFDHINYGKSTNTITPTPYGRLSIPSEEWISLTDNVKVYVKKYNGYLIANRDTNTIPTPDGLTIKQKVRKAEQ